jgi:hypothetical protein
MVARGMMRFVKHKETNVATEADVPMSQGVQEDLWCGHDDPVGRENFDPQVSVPPLIRLCVARDEADGDRNSGGDDVTLLLDERDSGSEKPADLERKKIKRCG